MLDFDLRSKCKIMPEVISLRIKEVCRETGLTDKAIRFYIKNGLINPSYTENYAGRKNFDFSQNDIAVLKRIAVLRKYSFSVNDIKTLLNDENSIAEVLDNQIKIVSQNAAETSFVLTNLKNAADNSPESLDALCETLKENIEPSDFNLSKQLNELWLKIKRKLPLFIMTLAVGAVFAAALLALITYALTKIIINFA